MVRWFVYNEYERIRKETVVTWYLPEGTEENHEKPQDILSSCRDSNRGSFRYKPKAIVLHQSASYTYTKIHGAANAKTHHREKKILKPYFFILLCSALECWFIFTVLCGGLGFSPVCVMRGEAQGDTGSSGSYLSPSLLHLSCNLSGRELSILQDYHCLFHLLLFCPIVKPESIL